MAKKIFLSLMLLLPHTNAWGVVYQCDFNAPQLDSEHPSEFTHSLGGPYNARCSINATHISCEYYLQKGEGAQWVHSKVTATVDASHISLPRVFHDGGWSYIGFHCQHTETTATEKKHHCVIKDNDDDTIMGEFPLEPKGAATVIGMETATWTCASGLFGVQCGPDSFAARPLPFCSNDPLPAVSATASYFETVYAENFGKAYRLQCDAIENIPATEPPHLETIGKWSDFPTGGLPENAQLNVAGSATHRGEPLIVVSEGPTLKSYLYDPNTQNWKFVGTLPAFASGCKYPSPCQIANVLSSPGGAVALIGSGLYVYTLKENPYRWEPLHPAPLSRYDSAAVVNGTKLFVVGGISATGNTNAPRALLFDLLTGEQKIASELGMPSGQVDLVTLPLGENEFLVWGGSDPGSAGSDVLNSGSIYNRQTNSWRPMSGVDVPSPISQRNKIPSYTYSFLLGTGRAFSLGGIPAFWGGWSWADGFSTALSFYDAQQDRWQRFEGAAPTLPLTGLSYAFENSDHAIFAYANGLRTQTAPLDHAWLFDHAKKKWFATPPIPDTTRKMIAQTYRHGFLMISLGDHGSRAHFFEYE